MWPQICPPEPSLTVALPLDGKFLKKNQILHKNGHNFYGLSVRRGNRTVLELVTAGDVNTSYTEILNLTSLMMMKWLKTL